MKAIYPSRRKYVYINVSLRLIYYDCDPIMIKVLISFLVNGNLLSKASNPKHRKGIWYLY